jgi:hypothetical protein
MTQNLYRSAKGKFVDMDKLAAQNELTPAISNVKINARGDELGPNGQIIRKREDVVNNIPSTNTLAQSHRPTQSIQPRTQSEPRVKQQYVSPPVPSPAPTIIPTSNALVKTDDAQHALKDNSSDKSHKGKS